MGLLLKRFSSLFNSLNASFVQCLFTQSFMFIVNKGSEYLQNWSQTKYSLLSLTKYILIFFFILSFTCICTCLGWSTAFCGSVLTLLLGWLVTFVTGCLKIEAVCRTGRDVFRSGFPYSTYNTGQTS